MRRSRIGIVRIKVDCIFRGIIYTRNLVTPDNKEAVNVLKNKLDKAGIFEQPGSLVFEFTPGTTSSRLLRRKEIDSQVCSCGHSRFAHVKSRSHRKDRGRCDVEGCDCKQYIPKQEEALK